MSIIAIKSKKEIEELLSHYLKRSYADPWYSKQEKFERGMSSKLYALALSLFSEMPKPKDSGVKRMERIFYQHFVFIHAWYGEQDLPEEEYQKMGQFFLFLCLKEQFPFLLEQA